MFAPPRSLSGAHLESLIAAAGGTRAALDLLDVTERTLRRWRAAEDAPRAVLRLLWYASPAALECASDELARALQFACIERDAVARKNAELAALLALAATSSPASAIRYAERRAVNDPVTPAVLNVALAFHQATAG